MKVSIKRPIQGYKAGDVVDATVIGGNFLRVKGEVVVLSPNHWELAWDDDMLDTILREWSLNYDGSK